MGGKKKEHMHEQLSLVQSSSQLKSKNLFMEAGIQFLCESEESTESYEMGLKIKWSHDFILSAE